MQLAADFIQRSLRPREHGRIDGVWRGRMNYRGGATDSRRTASWSMRESAGSAREFVGLEPKRGKDTQASRVARRGNQIRSGHAAHAGLHHGVANAEPGTEGSRARGHHLR